VFPRGRTCSASQVTVGGGGKRGWKGRVVGRKKLEAWSRTKAGGGHTKDIRLGPEAKNKGELETQGKGKGKKQSSKSSRKNPTPHKKGGAGRVTADPPPR